ncbi:MAG TPA: cyclic nucleotide-binding domain-containing protein [Chloroflexota bacterium]|nr:cyclic nucleotide-binding domain-containing protein [Chloroflexota bacterium]
MARQGGSYAFLNDQLSTVDKAGLLRTVPLLSDISDDYLLAIARHGKDVRVNPGDVLVREGDAGNDLMLLLEGTAEVRKGGQSLNRMGAGDYFGEISLLDGQPRSADVVATSPARVLILDHASFDQVMASEPTLARKLVLNLCRMIRGGAAPEVAEA